LSFLSLYEANYEEAEENITKLLEINSDEAVGYLLLGDLKEKQEDYEGFLKSVLDAIDKNPKKADCYRKLAQAYQYLEKFIANNTILMGSGFGSHIILPRAI